MKFKLINTKTNKEAICDKITIEGFDYYVSDGVITDEGFYISWETNYATEPKERYVLYVKSTGLNGNNPRKVIATNNPNIDIPKVVDEIENIVKEYVQELIDCKSVKEHERTWISAICHQAIIKSQKTHLFSEEDMIEFSEWCRDKAVREFAYGVGETNNWELRGEQEIKTTKELLELWKEQQPKIVYYNG